MRKFKNLFSKFLIMVLVITTILLITIVPGSKAASTNPLTSFYVGVDSNVCKGIFTGFEGIGTSNEVVETKDPAATGTSVIKKIPGRLTSEKLILTRGTTDDMSFYNWRKMVEDGKVTDAKKNTSVVMYDQSGKEIARWNLVNAWPCGVSYDFADGKFTETITIAYEKMQRVK